MKYIPKMKTIIYTLLFTIIGCSSLSSNSMTFYLNEKSEIIYNGESIELDKMKHLLSNQLKSLSNKELKSFYFKLQTHPNAKMGELTDLLETLEKEKKNFGIQTKIKFIKKASTE